MNGRPWGNIDFCYASSFLRDARILYPFRDTELSNESSERVHRSRVLRIVHRKKTVVKIYHSSMSSRYYSRTNYGKKKIMYDTRRTSAINTWSLRVAYIIVVRRKSFTSKKKKTRAKFHTKKPFTCLYDLRE